jgi:hypothetical protein
VVRKPELLGSVIIPEAARRHFQSVRAWHGGGGDESAPLPDRAAGAGSMRPDDPRTLRVQLPQSRGACATTCKPISI